MKIFITFSTCFYIIKSKFDPSVYIEWMNNFFSIVKNFFLVVYTDENSSKYINTNKNPHIKVIIKPFEEFTNYQYKDFWIENNNKNKYIPHVDWKLNVLWNEKVFFVHESYLNNYFPKTPYYGWCDIGYFRNRKNDTNTKLLKEWPNSYKLLQLKKDKIHYSYINNKITLIKDLIKIYNNKNETSKIKLSYDISVIAGGFFICHNTKLNWWKETYKNKLECYIKNNEFIKDDQSIIIDCIFSDFDKFILHYENNSQNNIIDNDIFSKNNDLNNFDNWFMFQRKLM